MGVYIKGMQMPDHCLRCPMKNDDDDCVLQLPDQYDNWGLQMERCPLTPVPDHGDLIDRDEYREDFMSMVYAELTDDPDWNRANRIIDAYDMAPTVIPADREGEA